MAKNVYSTYTEQRGKVSGYDLSESTYSKELFFYVLAVITKAKNYLKYVSVTLTKSQFIPVYVPNLASLIIQLL